MPSDLLLMVSSPSYSFSITNKTYFVDQITTLTAQSILLNILNPKSTNMKGNIKLNMYLSGYLTASGTVEVNQADAMYLGL